MLRKALCVGQPSVQHREEPTVPEVTVCTFRTESMVKLTDELRKTCSPEPSAASTEPDCVHPAGEGAVRCHSVQAELARRTQAKKEHSTRCAGDVNEVDRELPQRFPSSHLASCS